MNSKLLKTSSFQITLKKNKLKKKHISLVHSKIGIKTLNFQHDSCKFILFIKISLLSFNEVALGTFRKSINQELP